MDTPAESGFAVAIQFSWGATPTVARYVTGTESVLIEGETFVPIAEMEPSLAAMHGGTEDSLFEVKLPLVPPLTTMCRPYAHAPVSAVVWELDPADPAGKRVVYRGTIAKTVLNATGVRGLVLVTVAGYKSRLGFPLGIAVTADCPWTFGDSNCCKELTALQESYVVASVSGRTITLTDLESPRDDYWVWGSAAYDGLTLQITKESGDVLTLKRRPPPEWDNASITLTPGCDQKLATCRLWDNEHRFGGAGIAMQNYHPIIELPNQAGAV